MHKHQGKIESIIHQAYHRLPPAEEAARILFGKNVKEKDLDEVLENSVLSYTELFAVKNALRDLWKGIK